MVLAWTSTDPSPVIVQRQIPGGPWETIGEALHTFFVDTTAVCGQAYCYWVRSQDEPTWSTPVCTQP